MRRRKNALPSWEFALCHQLLYVTLFLNKTSLSKSFWSIRLGLQRAKHLQHFHEFLRGYTDIFSNNIYATKDYTYHNLRGMIQNKDIIVVKGDKDSSVVIMKKSDYVTKLDTMIDDGIIKGTYVETTDNTLKELSRFQDFLYRNFHKYERYKDMKPDSNQPARLYGTAKTHKFETLEDITVANLKF